MVAKEIQRGCLQFSSQSASCHQLPSSLRSAAASAKASNSLAESRPSPRLVCSRPSGIPTKRLQTTPCPMTVSKVEGVPKGAPMAVQSTSVLRVSSKFRILHTNRCPDARFNTFRCSWTRALSLPRASVRRGAWSLQPKVSCWSRPKENGSDVSLEVRSFSFISQTANRQGGTVLWNKPCGTM